jgi:predicted dehydrogenase/threonine dehydrogenase-like Zn-dependent dehydrogenase
MLQIIQYQKNGEMFVEELPSPMLKKGNILVRNVYSLISSGTERTSVETAQASMIGKAKSRPDLVKQVMDNVKREGVIATYKKVNSRLDNYKELGYSSAGIVIESSVDEFKAGDRVACAGNAYHAEIISIPKNLAAHIPENVSFEEAAFTTIGAIAMQGVRQADIRIGEYVAVIGLGLIGLITIQLIKSAGCRVIGIDINDQNFELAMQLGCDECAISDNSTVKAVESFTNGIGTDAVIITASTRSNEPLVSSLNFARKRSKVVVVGAVGMDIPRSPFYEKELELKISCSYGPGRYDSDYEEKGIDYPVGYVRWTENRNMISILDLLSQKKLNCESLITHKFKIQDALQAYSLITGKQEEKYLGILIKYPEKAGDEPETKKVRTSKNDTGKISGKITVGFIGAGNFAQSYLLPNLMSKKVELKGVVTTKPINALSVSKKFGFEFCSTDTNEILNNKDINTLFITTRHDTHAHFVIEALSAGKNVFVEKPLAINFEELESINRLFDTGNVRSKILTGFNRRFSKPFSDIKKFFKDNMEPLVINYRVNAGFIPKNHWIQDQSQGGRIIGEGCHFIDCISFLTDSEPVSVYASSLRSKNGETEFNDSVSIVINYSDGSIGNLLYLANGDPALPKEYCEVFSGGRSAVMNNFNDVIFFNDGKKKKNKYNGSKGYEEELDHFIKLVSGTEEEQISFASMYKTTLVTFRIMESLRDGTPVKI